ncbi:MAG: hypothetical protein N3F08_04555 [Crenarchaeota archaeon]|nr:hypothetical protein [Thermoproteota archaeon]
MTSPPEKQEYFMRVEAYFQKEPGGYLPLLVEALKKISKHVSTRFRTEVYEDFSMTLFHEEELNKTLHASLHFSGLRNPLMADNIVDSILELCEYVEAYLTVRGSIEQFQGLGENFFIDGVGVRVSTYPDKGVATFSYRLFKPNRGMNMVSRILSRKTGRSKTVSERLRSMLRL